MVVLEGRGELGRMKPADETVRGSDTRLPFIHCRQLMNCVVEDMAIHSHLKWHSLNIENSL